MCLISLVYRSCFVVVLLLSVFVCVAIALLMLVSFDQVVSVVLFHCSCNVVDVSFFVVRVVFAFRIVVTCI